MNWKEYEHTPTVELIELIKMKDKPLHLETAKAAYRSLYFRFFEIVAKKADIISKRNGYDKEFAIEVTEKAFERFWKYPSFNLQKMKVSSPDIGVELYLSRIAQNCFYDLMNERNGINISPYDGSEEIICEMPIIDEYFELNNKRLQIMNKVLSTFSIKHRIVYLTYLQHEQKGYKLPRKLLNELREKLNVTQDTIRFYRHEVISKINEYTEIWQKK